MLLSRAGEVARSFLGDYAGILQTDGYAGYNNTGGAGMVSAGCWAHARRYFVDAVKLNKLDAVGINYVKRMNALFAVDGEARDGNMSLAARDELRQEKAVPLVDEIHKKLLAVKGTLLPKSKVGQAVDYALGQWSRLTKFLQYPEIELSNNLAETSRRHRRWRRFSRSWRRASGWGFRCGSIWPMCCRGWRTGRFPKPPPSRRWRGSPAGTPNLSRAQPATMG